LKSKNNIKSLKRINDIGRGRKGFVRLDKNERTIPFENNVIKDMIDTIDPDEFSAYPDQSELYNSLSEFHDIPEDNILITSGSDTGIKYIFETFINQSSKIMTLWPTYAMVDVYTKMFEASPIRIGFDENLDLNLDLLFESINKIDLIYLANPNQPTGTVINNKIIIDILRIAKDKNILVLIDEAYVHFSDQESSINIVDSFPNLIILRTFSKGFGLASVRLGYMISHSSIIELVRKVKPILDINLFAIKFGSYLLKNYQIVDSYIKDVKESKLFLKKELKKHGFNCIMSHTNFIHINLPEDNNLDLLAEGMKTRGFLIRVSGSGLPGAMDGCIRITVGPKKQMKIFLDHLFDLLS